MTTKAFIFRINENGEGLDIVRNVCLEKGWIEYDEDIHDETEWNVWWKTARFRNSDYDTLKPWQRLNHYPKSTTISRKDCLARNLKRMKGVYGSNVYNFCPLSFNLPNDYTKFVAEYSKLRSKSEGKHLLWICKPIDLSRGRGIFIFKELCDLQYNCSAVVQKYIPNPMLISGYKFDLRIYVAVPSFHPLNIYIHQESIVRFSTEKYDLNSTNNVFSHLTNSSINKFSPSYTKAKERIGSGCKWTLTQLRYYFHQNHIDDRLLWQRIINIVTLTLITQSPLVPKVENCSELYGFDILVDENKKPWLIEVNFSPSLVTDCQIDYQVKKPVLHDFMEMLNLKETDMDHGKTSSTCPSRRSPYKFHTGSFRSGSRLSHSGCLKQLPDVVSSAKQQPKSPMPSANGNRPIFGLPLVTSQHSEDEGCISGGGDSPERERSPDKFLAELPNDKKCHPPRTPISRYSLRKINSKGSCISDSGISSFSGNSERSSANLQSERSDLRNKLKSSVTNILDMKGLGSGGSEANSWRYMVRKEATENHLESEDSKVNPETKAQNDKPLIKPSNAGNRLSVSNTRLLSPTRQRQKRHSVPNLKPWLQTSKSRLINQRQVGFKGPQLKFGDFFLTFPFNEATLKASQTSLDARVIIREIQKQLKEISSTGGSPDRLWYPIRPTEQESTSYKA